MARLMSERWCCSPATLSLSFLPDLETALHSHLSTRIEKFFFRLAFAQTRVNPLILKNPPPPVSKHSFPTSKHFLLLTLYNPPWRQPKSYPPSHTLALRRLELFSISDRGKPSGRGRGTRGRDRGCGRGHGRGGNTSEKHVRETSPTRIKETEEQRQARNSYNSWKRLFARLVDNSSIRRQLWEGAFSILEAGDRDWRQRLPQDLNEDDGIGHRHILALLSANISGTDNETFISNARNFLLTITHPSILCCLAVDTHVELIYNLFGGVGGKRAVSFLRRLIGAILAASATGATRNSTEDAKATLLAMAVALFELLRREYRVHFNDEIPSLVESIQTATEVSKDDVSSDSLARIFNKLNDTRALLARSQGLLADMNMDESNAADEYNNASSYPRDLIVPSGRFDNDKKDIADIVLFPTRDEIMSDAEEFLPYTNPDQPHFPDDPVQRHIDTFFRLLCHNIFGELKGALVGVMHTITQEPTALCNAKLSLGDMRAYH